MSSGSSSWTVVRDGRNARSWPGTPRDWFHQTAVECRDIYALAPPGCELGRDFINAASPRVERQILRAGYRLAKVLNDLFG